MTNRGLQILFDFFQNLSLEVHQGHFRNGQTVRDFENALKK